MKKLQDLKNNFRLLALIEEAKDQNIHKKYYDPKVWQVTVNLWTLSFGSR